MTGTEGAQAQRNVHSPNSRPRTGVTGPPSDPSWCFACFSLGLFTNAVLATVIALGKPLLTGKSSDFDQVIGSLSSKMATAVATETATVGAVTETTIDDTLKDYTLHFSAATPSLVTASQAGQRTDATFSSDFNPDYWPTQYRRIPPYRPINRNLDLAERPNGSNRAEWLFVQVMMNGVRLQSVSLALVHILRSSADV